jgi:hypothetical protein
LQLVVNCAKDSREYAALVKYGFDYQIAEAIMKLGLERSPTYYIGSVAILPEDIQHHRWSRQKWKFYEDPGKGTLSSKHKIVGEKLESYMNGVDTCVGIIGSVLEQNTILVMGDHASVVLYS